MTIPKSINLKMLLLWGLTIVLAFFLGIYATAQYTAYAEEKGLAEFVGGKENHEQLATMEHHFEKVYTFKNGETMTLSGDDLTTYGA